MLLKELLDINGSPNIPELDTNKLIKDLNDMRSKLVGNASHRELVATIYISEEQWNTDKRKDKVQQMIQDFNRAVTDALFLELSNQIKSGDDIQAKNFIFKAENGNPISKK